MSVGDQILPHKYNIMIRSNARKLIMSEISKKAIASALKWTWIIIVAAIAYNYIAPNYYFMRQGQQFYRGNKVTGSVEYLEDNEWVHFTESETGKMFRVERKKNESARAKKMQRRFLDAKNSPDNDDDILDFLDKPEKENSESRFSS
jgi:hypothetical protein